MHPDRKTPPHVHMLSALQLPQTSQEVLDNGVVFKWLDGGSQEVNQLSLIWTGGTTEADPQHVATLGAQLIREGTSQMTGAQISEFLDFHGAKLELVAEGHFTNLTLTTLNSQTLSVIPMLRQMVCAPTFPEQAFVTFRDMAAKNYMLYLNRVNYLSSMALSPLIKGPDSPEVRYPTPEGIMDIQLDAVRRFCRRVLTATTCRAYLSGRITPQIFQAVRSMLMSLPVCGDGVGINVVPYQPQPPQTVTTVKPDAVQASVDIGIPAPMRSHPDYVPLRMSIIGLGGYFGSRLMKNIREDKGYTYGIYSYLSGMREGSFARITAQTDPSYVQPVIAEIRNELETMATQPMPDAELTRLRQYLSSNLMGVLDTPFSIMEFHKNIDLGGYPDGYFDSQVDWTHRLDADTIMCMVARYLDPGQMRVSICSNHD